MKISRRNRDHTQNTILLDDYPSISMSKEGLFLLLEGRAGKYADIPYRVYLSQEEQDRIFAILSAARQPA